MKSTVREGMARGLSRRSQVSMAIVAALAAVLLLAPSAYSADNFAVKDAGGATLFTVTDTGTVGIKTTTPLSSLHLIDNSTSGSRGFISGQHNEGPQAGVIVLRKSRGTEAAPAAVVQGDYIATIHAQAHDGTQFLSNVSTGSLSFLVDGPVTTGAIPTGLTFMTGSTTVNKAERIRVTSSGNVGIGTSTPAHLIQLSGGAYSDGAVWTDASSRELKENIKNLSTEEALRTLRDLTPVKYNYKANADDKHVGFIAEDVPDLVATKDRKGLSPMDIVAVLTKVVQEQKQTIEAQQKDVAALTATMAELKAEIQKIESRNMTARIGE